MNRISEAELKAMEALHPEADCECCVVHRRLLSALRESYAEIDRLRGWMRRRAGHTADCHSYRLGPDANCTCGLSAMLDDDKETKPAERE